MASIDSAKIEQENLLARIEYLENEIEQLKKPNSILNCGALNVSESGLVSNNDGTNISNLTVNSVSQNSLIDIQNWTTSIVFTQTDHNTLSWSSGTINLSNGKVFNISAGNTGDVSALTYIYFDKSVSETALQTTTTASNAVGANKILVAVCQNVETGKLIEYQSFGGKGIGKLITSDSIASNTITANEIASNTITANKMSVSQLSAISANLGSITAGTITGATLQTASSGARCVMTSENGYQFFYDSTFKGKIIADYSQGIIYDTAGSSHFFRSGATEYAQINSSGLLLPNSKALIFTSSGRIIGYGGYLKIEGASGGIMDLQIEGNVYPNADNARQCGTADKRWQDINSEDAHIDDIFIGDRIYSSDGSQGQDYSSHKIITDIYWDSGDLKCKERYYTFKDGLITDRSGENTRTVHSF